MTAHGPLFRDYTPIPARPTRGDPMFRKLNYTEPAVLRGIFTAVALLAGAIGFVNTDTITGAGEVIIPVVAFFVPLLQAVWTRRNVSPATRADGPQKPGIADHAA